MRRIDREIKDPAVIAEILEECDSCSVALHDEPAPYIVPLSFGYTYAGGVMALYFHCAREGKKLDLLRRNPNAGFQMDCAHKLLVNEAAERYSTAYKSLIGRGTLEELQGEDKRHGLTVLMRHYVPERTFAFDERVLGGVAVLRLAVEEYAAKAQYAPR